MIRVPPARTWHAWLLCVLLLAGIAWPLAPGPAVSQPASPEAQSFGELRADSTVTIDFPAGIEISSRIDWDGAYEGAQVELLYTVAGDETATMAFVEPGTVTVEGEMVVTATLDFGAPFVPAGVPIAFWWRIVDAGVILAESPPEETFWFDTRWTWVVLETDQVRVHAYDHDDAFVQDILDSAQGTVTELEQRFGLQQSESLDIWVYPNQQDFQGAQQVNSRESIAGASYPGYLLIAAVVPDGSTDEIGRVIQHEVSHQVLHQATDNPFTYPPLWFDEGIATHFQVGGTDGYMDMVIRAHNQDALFAISSLDVSFPYQPAQATLAYASSWSVVEYIEQTWGDEGVSALISAFATGQPYDEALMQALGMDSDALDTAWRAWVADRASERAGLE